MKIIKPLRLGLLSRPYTLRRRSHLGLSVLALADMGTSPLLYPEADLWALAGEALADDGVLDLGVPKPCAEFLVSGSVYTAHQERRDACVARARVGDRQKSLIAFGDRYWVDGRATPPQPFDSVPLDWRHTYGGASYADNPHGRGADDEWIDGVRMRRLPNIEPMQARWVRPGQGGEPASLGPLSPTWPRRFQRAGTYHDDWPDQACPGFLDTLDPHFFNAAPADQWWPERRELAPGTDYELWNMHPGRPCQSGVLPDWHARCFVRRAHSQVLEAVSLALTTAWFFPDRERVLLIYQGAADLAEDDGADIDLLMPALDVATRLRPVAHYESVLERRLDPEDGPLHVLLDDELLPGASLGPWAALERWNPMNSPLSQNQHARAASLHDQMLVQARAAGLDPARFEVPLPARSPAPALHDLPVLAKQARHAAEEARIDMLHARRRLQEQLQAEAARMPAGITPASLMDDAQAPLEGGPPTLHEHAGLARLSDMAARQPAGAEAGRLDEAGVLKMMKQADGHLRAMYLQAAHLQAPAAMARPARRARLRRRVEALMAGSRNLSGLDLTGADLSGMDLRDARCVGTWFECADLSGARLDGADLSHAVLARVRASGGSWRSARLHGANLGGASLADLDLSAVSMADCQLGGIQLTRCTMAGLHMKHCHLAGATLTDCRFDGADFDTVTFWQQTRLKGVVFADARMERVSWVDCVFDEVAFPGADLMRCSWVQVQCDRPLNCTRACLTTCCVVLTDLDGAVFRGATLRECSLRDIGLTGADFSQAGLIRCDMSGADLRCARLTQSRADESLFIRADLGGADMSGADLKNALLHKADLRQASLRDANLFRADLAQSLRDASTDTRGAYTHLANTRPSAGAPC